MRKTRSKKDKKIEELNELVDNNTKARIEGPKKKHFSIHDLRTIKPLTATQHSMFESYFQGNHILAHGTPGTGKSFISLFLGLSDLLDKRSGADKIIIVRSAVSTRDIGALPGEIEEKLAPYEAPYVDIVNNLLGKYDAYNTMKSLGCIEFVPTSFIRGLTWDNAIIIIDEIQNMNFHEINSVITRTGENSRIIACGDVAQNDLFNIKNDQSGLPKLIDVVRKSNVFDEMIFTRHDIVRSNFVKKWICAVEDSENSNIVNIKRA